jgi:hypothetical protein
VKTTAYPSSPTLYPASLTSKTVPDPSRFSLLSPCTITLTSDGDSTSLSLNLDEHLGAKDGDFEFGGKSLSKSSRNWRVEEGRFTCEIEQTGGEWKQRSLPLSEIVGLEEGELRV